MLKPALTVKIGVAATHVLPEEIVTHSGLNLEAKANSSEYYAPVYTASCALAKQLRPSCEGEAAHLIVSSMSLSSWPYRLSMSTTSSTSFSSRVLV